MLLRKGQHFIGTGHGVSRTGHQRRTNLECNLTRFNLVAQLGNGVGLGANPGQPGINHSARKGFAFGQETIARMHCIGARFFGNRNQLGDVQIGVDGLVAIKAKGFIGHACVQGVDIGIGVNGHGLHTVISAGAGDADGDLATVGNQYFFHTTLFISQLQAQALQRREWG